MQPSGNLLSFYAVSTQIAEDFLAHFHSTEDVSVLGKSVKSHGSRSDRASKVSGSHASRVSATAAIKRAKADAAPVRLDSAEKEADLQKQKAVLVEKEDLSKVNAVRHKAEIDAELQLLSIKKEDWGAGSSQLKIAMPVLDTHCSIRWVVWKPISLGKNPTICERADRY